MCGQVCTARGFAVRRNLEEASRDLAPTVASVAPIDLAQPISADLVPAGLR